MRKWLTNHILVSYNERSTTTLQRMLVGVCDNVIIVTASAMKNATSTPRAGPAAVDTDTEAVVVVVEEEEAVGEAAVVPPPPPVPAPEPSPPLEVVEVEPPAAALTLYSQSCDTLTATDLPVDHPTLTITTPVSGTMNAMVLSEVRLPEHVLPAMVPAVASIKYCPLAPDTSKARLSPAVISPPHAMTVPALASLTVVLPPSTMVLPMMF